MQRQDQMINREWYWCTEHEEDLVETLHGKIEDFNKTMKYSRYLDMLIRNWRYYHGMYYPNNIDYLNSAIRFMGEQGELAAVASNHLRSLAQQLLTLTTSQRPSWQARAINSDLKSLEQARLGTNILDYFLRDKKLDKTFRTCVEQSLIWAQGFIKVTWDTAAGKTIDYDENGNAISEGDIKVEIPTIFDVVYDNKCSSWDDIEWIMVRTRRNRWNIIEQYPDARDDLLKENDKEDFKPFEVGYPGTEVDETYDLVSVWEFYHKRTTAVPEGRFMTFVGKKVLFDFPLPYDELPVYRVAPNEMVGLLFGYSPLYDLTALQEAYNHQISAILTNNKSFAVQNVWSKMGNNLTARQLEGGLNLIESIEKPEALQLCSSPEEAFTFADLIKRDMEVISGISSITRGQVERDMSGTAMALLDNKSIQQASYLINSYTGLLENVGTAILRLLRTFAQSERVISILGKHNQVYMHHFTADDLQYVDRVVVDSTNPYSKTAAGRRELADSLLNSQLIATAEEYLNVINTGNVEVMYEANHSQLSLVRDENESMMRGGSAFAQPIDHHTLHIKEHCTIISNTKARMQENNAMVAGVFAHIQQHIMYMQDPNWTALLTVLGYQPLPPMGIPMGPEAVPGQVTPGATTASMQSGNPPQPNPAEQINTQQGL